MIGRSTQSTTSQFIETIIVTRMMIAQMTPTSMIVMSFFFIWLKYMHSLTEINAFPENEGIDWNFNPRFLMARMEKGTR